MPTNMSRGISTQLDKTSLSHKVPFAGFLTQGNQRVGIYRGVDVDDNRNSSGWRHKCHERHNSGWIVL